MKSKIVLIGAIMLALTSMYVAVSKADAGTTIKVYSERQPFLIKPLIDQYEQNSGNKIEWIAECEKIYIEDSEYASEFGILNKTKTLCLSGKDFLESKLLIYIASK